MTEEQKARRKIYLDEYRLKNKARKKITDARWRKANPEKIKAKDDRFKKNNPGYIKPSMVDLGYWVVYLIHDFDGLNNIYCGQTQNIYTRMANHKSLGKLNTQTHEILEKFDNVDEALGFELTLHLAGYHGKYTREH